MRIAAALLMSLALAGCDLSMNNQPKHTPQSSPTLWADGPTVGDPPAGTIAQDQPLRDAALATPPPVTPALLARGRERFTIYCAPCHGAGGDGNGVIVQRGFPQPPSYHEPRLVAAPASHFVDVITNGYGIMYSFAERVEPADRWAIAAYIRALQQARRDQAAHP